MNQNPEPRNQNQEPPNLNHEPRTTNQEPLPRLVVIGAGAAGSMAAIFAASSAPGPSSSNAPATAAGRSSSAAAAAATSFRRVSTNRDSCRGSAAPRAPHHPVVAAARADGFFEQKLGLPLVEEVESAKLFPASQRAHDVRDRLLELARRKGVELRMEDHRHGLPAGRRMACSRRRGERCSGGRRRHRWAIGAKHRQRRHRHSHRRRSRPHDSPDLSRPHPDHRGAGAVRVACRRVAAGHDHGAFERSLLDSHWRLSLHPPRLQRSAVLDVSHVAVRSRLEAGEVRQRSRCVWTMADR